MYETDIRALLCSKRTLLSLLLMLIAFSGYALCDWILVYDWDASFRPSALQQTIGGIFFGGVMLMLPLCAAMSPSLMQIEEKPSGLMDIRVIRIGILRYSGLKLLSAFVTGACVMSTAFAIHSVIWNVIATPCDPLANDYLAIPFDENCIYAAWQPICYSLPIYLWMCAAIALCGGIWAMVGTTCSLFVSDRLLAVAMPFCLYYLWHSGLPGAITGIWGLPHPADLFNDALTTDTAISSVIIYGVIAFVCCLLHYAVLRRLYAKK